MNLVRIKKEVEGIVARASFVLRRDVYNLLEKAYVTENNKKAKTALGWILENVRVAQKESLAICQDTGLPVVFIEVGKNIKVSPALIETVKKGIEDGYRKNYLRQSLVDPLRRGAPAYKGVIVHVDFSSRWKGLKITFFPKGFGSENKSILTMGNPTAGCEYIERLVLESIKKAGPESCPPFIVGIGIGGTADYALLLAKKALLEKIDKPNPDRLLNRLEKGWLKKINSLKIGPMGLGGNSTCLAVKIKAASTHIAGLPVGINISCHALRSASLKISD